MEIYDHPMFWLIILCHLIYIVQLLLGIKQDYSYNKIHPSRDIIQVRLYLKQVNISYVKGFLALNHRLLEDPKYSQLHKRLEIELSKFASAHPNLYRKGTIPTQRKKYSELSSKEISSQKLKETIHLKMTLHSTLKTS